jgi:hypothetical protein
MAKTIAQKIDTQSVLETVAPVESDPISGLIQSATSMPDTNTVIEMITDAFDNPLAMPEECMNDQHPTWGFCWIPKPDKSIQSSMSTWQSYWNDGYRPCNKMIPTPSFWKTARFAVHGGIEKEGQILMCVERKVRTEKVRMQRSTQVQQRQAIKERVGLEEGRRENTSIQHVGVEVD